MSEATELHRQRFDILTDGQGSHLPDIDDDISVKGMLHGLTAHRPSSTSKQAA